MKKSAILVAIAGTVVGATASAQSFTFPSFNVTVPSTLSTTPLPAVPAGNWNYYRFSTNWSAVSGDPWSNEAQAGIWDLGLSQYLTSPFAAQFGAASNGNATTLRWGGALAASLSGGESLEFDAIQQFGGSVAQWDNVTITFQTNPDGFIPAGTAIPGAPSAISLGVVGVEGAQFSIDTFGSAFDTELGLYNQAGNLLFNNDDAQSTLQSEIDLSGAVYDGANDLILSGLSVGTYYIALGGFNTIYGATGFGVTAGNANGDYLLNLGGAQVSAGTLGAGQIQWYSFEIVPAPGAAGLLALGGLAAVRRRR